MDRPRKTHIWGGIMMSYPIALNILALGTKVKRKHIIGEEPYGATYEITDIAIFDEGREPCTLDNGGSFYYQIDKPVHNTLPDSEWVPSHSVVALSSASDEAQQLHQIERNMEEIDMLAWKQGLQPRPDNEKLPAIVTMLMAIQYDKEGGYGSSWKGKGEYRGIMANIDRKYDRLDKMTQDEISGSRNTLSKIEEALTSGLMPIEDVGESKIDAVADLTNYVLLYMIYLKETYPLTFNIWVDKNIPKYLRDKIPFLQE